MRKGLEPALGSPPEPSGASLHPQASSLGPCVHPDTSISRNLPPSAPRQDHCWLTGPRHGAGASAAQPVYTVHHTQAWDAGSPRGERVRARGCWAWSQTTHCPRSVDAAWEATSNLFSARGVIPLHIPTELAPFLGRNTSFQERKSHQTKPNKKSVHEPFCIPKPQD